MTDLLIGESIASIARVLPSENGFEPVYGERLRLDGIEDGLARFVRGRALVYLESGDTIPFGAGTLTVEAVRPGSVEVNVAGTDAEVCSPAGERGWYAALLGGRRIA